jgi:hypothetical protein
MDRWMNVCSGVFDRSRPLIESDNNDNEQQQTPFIVLMWEDV